MAFDSVEIPYFIWFGHSTYYKKERVKYALNPASKERSVP
jgi:hypothetical protein